MKPFKRRTYRNLREPLSDILTIVRNRSKLRGETLTNAFRERLMLAVTEVNRCRYCAYYHARQALVEGLSKAELQALTEGDFDTSPPEERPALLYAQHWAEAKGQPDPAARRRLRELYGDDKADAIEITLRIIRVGNLAGNTLDKLLYYATLGHWGRTK